jgi:FlaA1/EpsC-like NDP-sugar epimerase
MSVQSARRTAKAGDQPATLQRVLIAGAGEAGAMVLRELRANPQMGLIPVGFVDDDPAKQNMLIHRIRVLGDRIAIPTLVRQHRVDQVIIAMPSASGKAIRTLLGVCEAAGVRTRTIPGMYELLGGNVSISQLRDVQIEDLLRREPVKTDTAQVTALLRGRRVLVTGAGGSIGAELCRQIARCDPVELTLLGHGENSIFDIYNELSKRAGERGNRGAGETEHVSRCTLHAVIADVRDGERLRGILMQRRPEIVFHAAAHKHVPLMEENEVEAVTNNVLGTLRLVEASLAADVQAFVLISTDKAVNPTSVMGATKRVAELLVQAATGQTGGCYVAVRFGNVLGSRGSVVPLFRQQIAAGGPVTVTHPDIKRYFMTIPEAVQLVLQAAALGRGGEVFVLDMGEPVRIADLACDLIRLSGLEPGRDIDIAYTGLRPGEKLFEELSLAGESYRQTVHSKIFAYENGPERKEPGEVTRADWPRVIHAIAPLLSAAERSDRVESRRQLGVLVPEYRPAVAEL